MKGENYASLMERVARTLLGEPNRHHSRREHPRWGKNGSLAIDISTGTWFDHEAKVGGGVVDLIRRHGHDKPVEWLESRGLIHVNGNGGTKWNGAKAKPKAAKPAPKKPLRSTGEFPGLGPPVKVYRYEKSTLEVCRFEPKDFRQRHADPDAPGWFIWNTDGCAIVPYKLPALRKGIEADEWVYIVEGEKDVENAATIGLVATCNPMGANKWTDGFEQHFKGANICILPDNDETGRKHQELYAAKLAPVAKKLVTLELPGLPDKGDLSDFVAAYDSPQAALEAFQNAFKDQAREWQAPADEPHQDAANDQDSVLSEHDCAITFIDGHKDVLRYCHGGADGWFIWDGQRWRQDTTRRAFDMLRETIQFIAATGSSRDRKAAGRASFCTGAETYARALSLVAVEPNAFDQDDWLLGTPGGTCDLRTGELHPAHPDEMISKLTAVAPAPPGTQCPLWFKFLAEASGGDADLVAFLQRFCGYALTGSTREQKLSFVIGTGKNGKSVYVKTVQKVFGEYATVAAMSTFTAQAFESHPEEIASLAGARLVIANETKEGTRWDEVRVKSLTAGDAIRARFMRQNSFVFQPRFKLLFLGNTAPEIATLDAAMRRRFLMVPFNIVPAKEDQELEQKLTAEWSAILRWMVDGCLAWQREGLKPPASVQEATSTYLDEQDLFADWLCEYCDVDPGNIYKKTSVSALYASWCEYAKKFGRRPASKQSFGMAMPRHGFKSKQFKEFNGKGYEGIQLRPLDMPWGDR